MLISADLPLPISVRLLQFSLEQYSIKYCFTSHGRQNQKPSLFNRWSREET